MSHLLHQVDTIRTMPLDEEVEIRARLEDVAGVAKQLSVIYTTKETN